MDENFLDVTKLVDEKMDEKNDPEIFGYVFGNKTNLTCNEAKETKSCHCHKRLKIGTQIAQEIRQKLFEVETTIVVETRHRKIVYPPLPSYQRKNTKYCHQTTPILLIMVQAA